MKNQRTYLRTDFRLVLICLIAFVCFHLDGKGQFTKYKFGDADITSGFNWAKKGPANTAFVCGSTDVVVVGADSRSFIAWIDSAGNVLPNGFTFHHYDPTVLGYSCPPYCPQKTTVSPADIVVGASGSMAFVPGSARELSSMGQSALYLYFKTFPTGYSLSKKAFLYSAMLSSLNARAAGLMPDSSFLALFTYSQGGVPKSGVVNLSESGAVLWVRSMPYGDKLAILPDGSFLLAGTRLCKYAPDGSALWGMDYPGLQSTNYLTVESDGTIVMAGVASADTILPGSGKDYFFLRVDSTGTPIDYNEFGNYSDQEALAITPLPSGEYMATGKEGAIMQLSRHGGLLWARRDDEWWPSSSVGIVAFSDSTILTVGKNTYSTPWLMFGPFSWFGLYAKMSLRDGFGNAGCGLQPVPFFQWPEVLPCTPFANSSAPDSLVVTDLLFGCSCWPLGITSFPSVAMDSLVFDTVMCGGCGAKPLIFPAATSYCDTGDIYLLTPMLMPPGTPAEWWVGYDSLAFGHFFTLHADSAGTYPILINAASGLNCTMTNAMTITVFQQEPFPEDTLFICGGDSVWLTAAGDYTSLDWDSIGIADSILVMGPGVHWVTASDINGCVGRDTVHFIDPATIPAPVLITDTLCLGESAVVFSYGTVHWFGSPTDTILIAVGDSLSSPGLVGTDTFYVGYESVGGCITPRFPLAVTWVDPPSVPLNITPPVQCAGTVFFAATSSGTIRWYFSPVGGFPVITGDTFLISTTVPFTVYAEAFNDYCVLPRVPITVIPSDPVVNFILPVDFDSICSSSLPILLSGGIPAGGSYTGAGVSGGYFDPSIYGVGVYYCIYTYIDSIGCSSAAYDTIAVVLCEVENAPEMYGTQILVYPNPASYSIHVISSIGSHGTVLNSSGQVVWTGLLNKGETPIQTQNWPDGLYVLWIGEDGMAVVKFAVIH